LASDVYNELGEFIKGRISEQEPMSRHTSWRIGGPAEIFVEPAGLEDLRRVLVYAQNRNLPVTVIGNGTNLLVSDRGIRGLVIQLGPGLSGLEVRGNEIYAEAGVSLPRLANRALRHGLAGFEILAGIPGTVGGALLMNAGANGCSVGDRVLRVEALDYAGNRMVFERFELKFMYRESCLSRRRVIVTGALFNGIPADREEIKSKMEEYQSRRRNTQPLEWPNAGSVFKNPPGDSAGRLIELAGCKEMRVGAIQVSSKHANFFINLGNGTAEDVLRLVEEVRRKVEEKCGVKLLLEVQKLGEF